MVMSLTQAIDDLVAFADDHALEPIVEGEVPDTLPKAIRDLLIEQRKVVSELRQLGQEVHDAHDKKPRDHQ